MDNVIGIALATVATIGITLVFKSSIIALSLWFNATWPERSEGIYTAYTQRPWRCGFIGLINTAVFVFIGLLLLDIKPLGLLGLLLILAVVWLHLWGRAAIYRRMAEKLGLKDHEFGTIRSLTLGGIASELIFLVPVIGQVLYTGTTLRAMGAVIVTILSRGHVDENSGRGDVAGE